MSDTLGLDGASASSAHSRMPWSELTRSRLPVIAAPMFLGSTPELVVAAGRVGVVGAFPAANCRTIPDLDAWMLTIRQQLSDEDSASWAVNLITHSTNARLADELALVAEHRPPVVISALGSPAPVVDVVHRYGGVVLADVISLRLARKAASFGVDGLVCVSAGAGGHTGHLSPYAFVSAVREFFDGIVAVGGGISTGAGVAGALAAGADIAYIGTLFLTASESGVSAEYRKMIVDSGSADLVVSEALTGAAASWLRPSLVRAGIDPESLGGKSSLRFDVSSDRPTRWRDIWAAGQGIETIRDVRSVALIVGDLERELADALERLRLVLG